MVGRGEPDQVRELRGIVGAFQILPVALHQTAQGGLGLGLDGKLLAHCELAAAEQDLAITVLHGIASFVILLYGPGAAPSI